MATPGSSGRIVAVTAVYDIGRAEYDARTVLDYMGWLNRTVQLPVQFVVFLDAGLDPADVLGKPDDIISVLPKEELAAFARWSARVAEICRRRSEFPASEDLTFRLPAYALVQFSKFELMTRAIAQVPGSDAVLWIDAGISRFLDDDLTARSFDKQMLLGLIAGKGGVVNVTPTLERAMAQSDVGISFAGTCERLVTGETFLLTAGDVNRNRKKIEDYVEKRWLDMGKWDNEQVALGEMLIKGQIDLAILDSSGRQAEFVNRVFPKRPQAFDAPPKSSVQG